MTAVNAPVYGVENVCRKAMITFIVDEMHLFNVNEQSVFIFLLNVLEKNYYMFCA